jgi:hypothetical protein
LIVTETIVRRRSRRGVAFILALFFLVIFASMAVAVVSTASSNMVIARNRTNAQQSQAMADGGVCLILKTLGGVDITGAADAAGMRQSVGTKLKTVLAASSMLNANNITWDSSGIHLPTATVTRADGSSGQCDITINPSGGAFTSTTVTVLSVGRFGGASRTANYRLSVDQGPWTLPNYGIATRGAITMPGNATISGANNALEGSVLSGTLSVQNAVTLPGIDHITGNLVVCNSAGKISKTGIVTIDGQQTIGTAQPNWPQVNISAFTPSANNVRTSGSSSIITLSNIRIPPNTNPTFSGITTINGVVYIQSPNKVTFGGNLTLTGVIVCDTPTTPNLTTNQVIFSGNVQSYGVESLPVGSQYDGLRNLMGSFLLAPGYAVSFTGNSTIVNGCMVADKFTLTGNSGGRIKGGIFGLGDNLMTLGGNSPLVIDKSGMPTNPAGLVSSTTRLVCMSGSYSP